MKTYEFGLLFDLKNDNINPDIYVDSLYDSGCDDALLAIGRKGSILLDFTRTANSAYQAIYSAIQNVKSVIPSAELIHISPDIVGVKELSLILECSKQNIQKYLTKKDFPKPLYSTSQPIWYLDEVLEWFLSHQEQGQKIDDNLLDIARLARSINLSLENKKANLEIVKQAQELVAI
jgi:predicted DNA-binding transcriptional regulator AlpA